MNIIIATIIAWTIIKDENKTPFLYLLATLIVIINIAIHISSRNACLEKHCVDLMMSPFFLENQCVCLESPK